jgi:hypothetical protein
VRASIINQYPMLDSTAERLTSLFRAFVSYKTAQFRGLLAFASEAGFRMLEPSLRDFLNAGHSVFWIVGVDLGGTGRQALQFLYDLKRDYPKQVDARVFSAADNQCIFHPKVYWLDSDERKVKNNRTARTAYLDSIQAYTLYGVLCCGRIRLEL